jgi:hypothetical protein
MARSFIATAALLAALAQAPVATGNDLTQLIEAAGLTSAEAAGMTLNQIQAHKYNRAHPDDTVTVSTRSAARFDAGRNPQLVGSAGLGPEATAMPLSEVVAYKVNRGADGDGRIPVGAARVPAFDAAAHPQLVGGAGLTPSEAAGMTLGEIQAARWNRAHGGDERQYAAD